MMARRLLGMRRAVAPGELYASEGGSGLYRTYKGSDGFVRLSLVPGYGLVQGGLVSLNRFVTLSGSMLQQHGHSTGLSTVLASSAAPPDHVVLLNRIAYRDGNIWRFKDWDGNLLGPIGLPSGFTPRKTVGDGTRAYLLDGRADQFANNFGYRSDQFGRLISNAQNPLPNIALGTSISHSDGPGIPAAPSGWTVWDDRPATPLYRQDHPSFGVDVPPGAEGLPIAGRERWWRVSQSAFDGVDTWLIAQVMEQEIRWNGTITSGGNGYLSISRKHSYVLFRFGETSLEIERIFFQNSTYLPAGWWPMIENSSSGWDDILFSASDVVQAPGSYSHRGDFTQLAVRELRAHLGVVYWVEGTHRVFRLDTNEPGYSVSEITPTGPSGLANVALNLLPKEGILMALQAALPLQEWESRDNGATWTERPSDAITSAGRLYPLYPRAYPPPPEDP